MRAGHTVGPGPERSRGYFLLLRRLLDMGMDPNPKTSHGLTAWQHALEQYDQFARKSYPSYYVEESKAENRQLREMLKAVLDELLKHGADIIRPYVGRDHRARRPEAKRRAESSRPTQRS